MRCTVPSTPWRAPSTSRRTWRGRGVGTGSAWPPRSPGRRSPAPRATSAGTSRRRARSAAATRVRLRRARDPDPDEARPDAAQRTGDRSGRPSVRVDVEADGITLDVRDEGPRAGSRWCCCTASPRTPGAGTTSCRCCTGPGLRTLAPDQRGYSPGARPRDVSAYRVEHPGRRRPRRAGRRWGVERPTWSVTTGVGRWPGTSAPGTPTGSASLTVLSTPHPAALARSMARSLQPLRSWYTLAVQVPVLPEIVLARTLGPALRLSGLPAGLAARVRTRGSAAPRPCTDRSAGTGRRAAGPRGSRDGPGPGRPGTSPCPPPTSGAGTTPRWAARRPRTPRTTCRGPTCSSSSTPATGCPSSSPRGGRGDRPPRGAALPEGARGSGPGGAVDECGPASPRQPGPHPRRSGPSLLRDRLDEPAGLVVG